MEPFDQSQPRWANVSITCVGEHVGLEEIDDGVWNVYFGPLKLGRLLEKHMRIEDTLGRLKRHLSPMSQDFFVTYLLGPSYAAWPSTSYPSPRP